MPWTDHSLHQRTRFVVAARIKAEPFTILCARFGITRPTGYKWLARYLQHGTAGLAERSRRPLAQPTKLHVKWRERVILQRRTHRTWGSKKVRTSLRRSHPRARLPSLRTIDRWLKAALLTRPASPRRRFGPARERPKLTIATHPNDVWTVDFKGWFCTGDRRRCDTLTVRDLASRYLLGVLIVPHVDEACVHRAMAALFRRFGLPRSIRVDNGSPFGAQGALGLSLLSVWWLRLGIQVDFTRPAKPQDNGAHEQMHRVLKAETLSPPAANSQAQQRRFQRWAHTYNHLRPHEALAQRVPAQLYRPSPRSFHTPLLSTYPVSWPTRHVRPNGWIKWRGILRFIGRPFARQVVGLQPASPEHSLLYLDKLFIGSLHQGDGAGSMRSCSYLTQHPSRKGSPGETL